MSQVQSLLQYHLPFDAKQFISETRDCPEEPELLQELWNLVHPVVFWRDAPISSREADCLILGEDALRIDSIYVAQGLAQCSRATVLALTIGPKLPQEAARCAQRGALYRSSIADLLGSHAVERLAQSFCDYLQQRALPKGLFATLRYSPGYGDWSLTAQRQVLPYLHHCSGMITLSENCLMEPVKSITAVIGWASTWQKPEYPQGNHHGFCNGGHNCVACTTWACRKHGTKNQTGESRDTKERNQ